MTMGEEKFEWTDELAVEFYFFARENNGDLTSNERLIEKFKQQKAKKPLFTTEDGKDIYEGGGCWIVETDFKLPAYKWECVCKAGIEELCKYFSTEQAAKDYILHNKPCLSLHEIESYFLSAEHFRLVKELVRKKLGL